MILQQSKLDLDKIRINGGTQSRLELNESVVADYADAITAGSTLPPVVVFFDGTDHWLADGFHRYFGHKKLELVEIAADIRDGTRRDAVLYSVGANGEHGLRRSNADKRKAVETVLKDPEWMAWSDRKIAEVCGVGAPLVGDVRRSICNPITDASATRIVERNGKIYTQDTSNIGRAQFPKLTPEPASQPKADQAAALHKPESNPVKPAPAAPQPTDSEAPDDYTEIDAARDQISELQIEVHRLNDRLAIECYDVSEEEKTEASRIIADLRAEVQSLTAQLAAVTISRNDYMTENAQLKRQCQLNMREIAKLKTKS